MAVGGARGCAIWGAVAVVGIGLVAAAAVALRWPDRSDGGRDRDRSQNVSLEDQDYQVGDCLTWAQSEQGPEADRADIVPCAQEHLRQVVGIVSLGDVEGGFPSEEAWRDLRERCHPYVERVTGPYENSVLHPLSRPTIKPSPDTWARGDRKLVCEIGVRQVDLAAKRARVRVPFRGRAEDLDLLSPFEAGDCVSWTEDEVGTVPCDQAHQYEVTGVVDLRADATRASRVADAERVSRDACPRRLGDHLGDEPVPGVSWTWIPMDQDDLDGGVHGLVCLAARFGEDGALDLVGPLRP